MVYLALIKHIFLKCKKKYKKKLFFDNKVNNKLKKLIL